MSYTDDSVFSDRGFWAFVLGVAVSGYVMLRVVECGVRYVSARVEIHWRVAP